MPALERQRWTGYGGSRELLARMSVQGKQGKLFFYVYGELPSRCFQGVYGRRHCHLGRPSEGWSSSRFVEARFSRKDQKWRLFILQGRALIEP